MLCNEILLDLEMYLLNNSININSDNIELNDTPLDSLKCSDEINEDICCYESCRSYTSSEVDLDELTNFIETNKTYTFQELLFDYIDRNKLSDSEVYKKANIDRRLFSKIRCDKNYKPSKSTVISLGLAIQLTEEQIEELLESVGYTLSNSSTFDLIICFCIKQKIFNIMQVNFALDKYNCLTL